MKRKYYFLSILPLLITFLFIQKSGANNSNICQNELIEASYQLKDSWIFICSENDQKTFIQLDQNKNKELVHIPAFGTFPTYAALEGEASDPNSKIYNISPYDFKIIQASIIQQITPVKEAIYPQTNTKVTVLSGNKEQEAIAVCQDKKPVQVFETKTENIYICIEAEEDINSINLSYIQKSKNNSYPLINLPAELTSSFSYATKGDQTRKYSISYQGLVVSAQNQKKETIPVTNLYLALPDMSVEDTH